MPATRNANEIYITREYDAPLATVWEAWTDPEKVAQWWGPRGFTLTTHSKDLRPGGTWNYTMHGPDGVDYPNITLYHEVEEHRKLVYGHGASEDRPPMFRVTVLFTEVDGKTHMDMTMALPTPEEAAATRKIIKQHGGNSTWDRLAEYLEQEITGKVCFVINRSFAAPREVVFAAWTDPAQIAKWLPPAGFEMEFLASDIRVGGTSTYRMFNNAGMVMNGRIAYREIDPPERLVNTQEFCDEDGKLSRHPALPTWPATMLRTVLFKEEGPGATRITVIWEAAGETTAEEVATFLEHRPSMTQGWTGSFDKLEEVLAAR